MKNLNLKFLTVSSLILGLSTLSVLAPLLALAETDDYYSTTISYTCTAEGGCPDDVDPSSMTQEEIDAYNEQQRQAYEQRLAEEQARYEQDLERYQNEVDARVAADQAAYEAYQAQANQQQQDAESMVASISNEASNSRSSAGTSATFQVLHGGIAAACCAAVVTGSCCPVNLALAAASGMQASESSSSANSLSNSLADLDQFNYSNLEGYQYDSNGNPIDPATRLPVAGPNQILAYPNLDTDDPNDFTNQSNFLSDVNAATTDAINQLNSLGYTFDPKTGELTYPDGRNFNINDFKSPEAMASAGFPQDEVDAFFAGQNNADLQAKFEEQKKAVEKRNKDLQSAKERAITAATGKSVKAPVAAVEEEKEDPWKKLMRGFKGKRKTRRGLASFGGKTASKKFGNDLIGHSEENIFQMIHRRYRTKANKGEFITPLIRTINYNN
ncbi:MAG: hypothetical protein CL677_09620 [Bdellovibrionaceae bacterium]|nr:hypothetical protein [Pseudobdellovibrionaceae bacterium]